MQKKGQMSQNNRRTSIQKNLDERSASEQLVRYFSKEADLSEDDILLLEEKSHFLKVSKKHFLLEEGGTSDKTFFIVKGLLRLFTRTESGEEFNVAFYAEDWWVNESESYTTGSPSRYCIQALEKCILVWFYKADFDMIIQRSSTLLKITYTLIERNLSSNKIRIAHQIQDSPEKRYAFFVKTYASIVSRIPLYMIASFLGISRKTLTRIRGGV